MLRFIASRFLQNLLVLAIIVTTACLMTEHLDARNCREIHYAYYRIHGDL